MSLFCGIYALDAERTIPPAWRGYVRKSITRTGEGQLNDIRAIAYSS